MRRIVVLVVVAGVLALVASGCGTGLLGQTRGSGDLVRREIALDDPRGLKARHAFHVEVRRGARASLSLQVDDNILGLVRVGEDGDVVTVGLRAGASVRDATLEATLTLPDLRLVDASGAATVRVHDGLGDADLRVAASGASTVTVEDEPVGGSLDVLASGASRVGAPVALDRARIEASGASTVSLDGTTDDLRADASGASRLELTGLEARTADVDLSGASRADVVVRERLSASASGASTLRYDGGPTLARRETSGGSTIEPR